jgi:hypothetical protein
LLRHQQNEFFFSELEKNELYRTLIEASAAFHHMAFLEAINLIQVAACYSLFERSSNEFSSFELSVFREELGGGILVIFHFHHHVNFGLSPFISSFRMSNP